GRARRAALRARARPGGRRGRDRRADARLRRALRALRRARGRARAPRARGLPVRRARPRAEPGAARARAQICGLRGGLSSLRARRARARHPARPLVPFGHSNGALIVLRAVQAGVEGAVGLVLTGPLLGLPPARRAVPDPLARLLSAALPRLPVPNGIRSEDLTHDEALREAHRRDRRVHRVATPRWYWEMTLAARAALADAGRVTLPLLI